MITRAARWKPLLVVTTAALSLAAAGVANATVPSEGPAGVYSAPLFKIGGGMPPQGSGQVGIHPGALLGPRWSDLFNPDGTLRDAFGPGGVVGANGIADAIDLFGGRGAISIHDGSDVENPAEDVNDACAFFTPDGTGRLLIFGSVERLEATGSSFVEFEFNQDRPRFAIIRDGFSETIRPIVESRRPGDILVRLNLRTDGSILSTEVGTWSIDATGAYGYRTVETVAGEGCSFAETTCAFSHADAIDMGSGDISSPLAPRTFIEFGISVGNFLNVDPTVSTVQVRTVSDVASATTDGGVSILDSILATTLPTVTCPSNLNSCTANDVVTTVKSVDILNNDICDSLNDTITLRVTASFSSTSNERYDLGVYVSKDGGTVQEPSSALICGGAAPQVGEGNPNAYPDADTDLFLNIDPTGHANTPSTPDTCGDLSSTAGPVDWTFDSSVKCNIVNGQLIIPSCRVWEQNANHKVSCQTLSNAGTGSKCDCTDLVVTTELNPCATKICNDDNTCTVDTCVNNNGTGECVFTPVAVGTECGDPASGPCDSPDTCDANGVCQPNTKPSTTICRSSAGPCDVAESCDGINAACPDDGFKASTTQCRASAGICDVAESCTGNGAGCPDDGFKAATTVCRPSSGTPDCDPAESCDGSSDTCPPDGGNVCPNRTIPQIAPTATTCQQFRDNQSETLTTELYTLNKAGKINSISPGVFFLYDGLHMSATGTVTVTESGYAPWTRSIGVQQNNQVTLYNLSCTKLSVGTLSVDAGANVTITGVPAGDYILSVKYDPGTLNGYKPPTKSTTYSFAVTAGGLGSGSAGVLVDKKP